MPELPEVETIARNLRDGLARSPRAVNPPPDQKNHFAREPRPEFRTPDLTATPLIGRMITNARVLWHRTLATPSVDMFVDQVVGQTITDVGRRGKYLIIHLTDDKLLIHLRMSGDMLVTMIEQELAPHDRMVLELDNTLRLAFNDTRKFGRAWLVKDPTAILGKLGPEPFDPKLQPATFHQMLSPRKRQLKPLLLDQSFLAGMGNIYTDEALHRSNLHPRTLANTVTREQADTLLANIRFVLEEGIRSNGASIDWVYRGGGFQNQFTAYGRTGEPCFTCSTPIERILVGQRSTHYCPNCQPEMS